MERPRGIVHRMPTVTRIYETILYARDLDAAAAFYGGVLGLPALPRQSDRGVVFRMSAESVLIVFDPTKTAAPHPEVPSHGAEEAGHVAFTVPELESWRTRLAEHGIEIEREVDWPLGGRSVYARDPAGNSVEFVQGRVWDLGPSAGNTADPLDIMLEHNAWATREVLRACLALDGDAWTRRFEIGPGSLHDTLTHVVGAMLRWADRIEGPPRVLRPSLENGTLRSPAELIALLDEAASDLARAADIARQRGLATENDLTFGGQTYRFTLGAMLVHVATHGMHHRAQCLNMLRRLAVPGVSDRLPEIDALDWQLAAQ